LDIDLKEFDCDQRLSRSSNKHILTHRTSTNQHPSRIPAAITLTHIYLVFYLTFTVGRTIYRSKLALTPSSSTRHRQHLRRGHVRTFSILAAVSLLGASYFAASFAGLSYRVWAAERGIGLPES
jgi:hypothetical protein